MILKGNNYRIGSWAGPYIEELLNGGHVHNPYFYLEGRARMTYIPSPTAKGSKGGSWIAGYNKSWWGAISKLENAGYEVVKIYHWHPGKGDIIFVLKKYFKRYLKNRLIDEYKNYRLYRLEDRNLLFRNNNFDEFNVYHCKYKTISAILAEEVINKLDENT